MYLKKCKIKKIPQKVKAKIKNLKIVDIMLGVKRPISAVLALS